MDGKKHSCRVFWILEMPDLPMVENFRLHMVQLCKFLHSILGSKMHTCAQHTMTASYMHSICHCSVTFNTLHIVLFKSNQSLFFTMATDKSLFHRNSPQIPICLLFPTPALLLLLLLLFPLNEEWEWEREREKHIVFNETIVFLWNKFNSKLNFDRPIMIQSREKNDLYSTGLYKCECVCMCVYVCFSRFSFHRTHTGIVSLNSRTITLLLSITQTSKCVRMSDRSVGWLAGWMCFFPLSLELLLLPRCARTLFDFVYMSVYRSTLHLCCSIVTARATFIYLLS